MFSLGADSGSIRPFVAELVNTIRLGHYPFPAWEVFIACRYNIHYNVPMSKSLKITTVGNSAGVVLPREILERLHVEKGDTLYVLETPNGIELTPYDPEFSEQMEIAKRVMRDNRDLLRKLAE